MVNEFKGIKYHPKHKYKLKRNKGIRVPTKERINLIIAQSGRIQRLKLKISMVTGLRPIELFNLKVKDFDPQTRKIYPTTAKHGTAGTLTI